MACHLSVRPVREGTLETLASMLRESFPAAAWNDQRGAMCYHVIVGFSNILLKNVCPGQGPGEAEGYTLKAKSTV